MFSNSERFIINNDQFRDKGYILHSSLGSSMIEVLMRGESKDAVTSLITFPDCRMEKG